MRRKRIDAASGACQERLARVDPDSSRASRASASRARRARIWLSRCRTPRVTSRRLFLLGGALQLELDAVQQAGRTALDEPGGFELLAGARELPLDAFDALQVRQLAAPRPHHARGRMGFQGLGGYATAGPGPRPAACSPTRPAASRRRGLGSQLEGMQPRSARADAPGPPLDHPPCRALRQAHGTPCPPFGIRSGLFLRTARPG